MKVIPGEKRRFFVQLRLDLRTEPRYITNKIFFRCADNQDGYEARVTRTDSGHCHFKNYLNF